VIWTKVIERNNSKSEQISEEVCKIPGLYFDGKNDRAMAQTKKIGGKYHHQTIAEEHIEM